MCATLCSHRNPATQGQRKPGPMGGRDAMQPLGIRHTHDDNPRLGLMCWTYASTGSPPHKGDPSLDPICGALRDRPKAATKGHHAETPWERIYATTGNPPHREQPEPEPHGRGGPNATTRKPPHKGNSSLDPMGGTLCNPWKPATQATQAEIPRVGSYATTGTNPSPVRVSGTVCDCWHTTTQGQPKL